MDMLDMTFSLLRFHPREREITRAQVGKFWRLEDLDSSVSTKFIEIHFMFISSFIICLWIACEKHNLPASTKGRNLGLRWRYGEIYLLFFWAPCRGANITLTFQSRKTTQKSAFCPWYYHRNFLRTFLIGRSLK